MKGRCTKSITAAVEANAGMRLGAPAITDGDETVSYRDLFAFVSGAAGMLEDASAPGDVIEVEMAPKIRCVAALLACELTARIAVLLPPGLPIPEREEARQQSRVRFVMSDHTEGGTTAYHLHRISDSPSAPLPHGVAQLTSGSLGPSRLALRGWGGIRREIDAVASRLGLRADDRVLCASSIAHSYGLIGGLLAPLTIGAHITLSSPDVPNVESCRPTILFGLARSYRSILARPPTWKSLRDMRFALSAGAPLPAGLFDEMRRRTGVPIRQDYGTTETGTISIDDSEPARPDGVGRPLAHMNVRIGADGEVQVQSEAVALGYLVEGRLVPADDADGWYHTHDAGSLVDGILHVGNRIRPPMSIGQTTVIPDDLEAAIERVPGVREAVVLSVGHGDTASIRAVVATSLDVDVLSQRLSAALPADRRPQEIEVVDALPRSPAGKVLQKYLI